LDSTLGFYALIGDGLAEVEDRLRKLPQVDFPELGNLLAHVYHAQGKRMRPAVTILASRLHPGPREAPIIMGVAVELLHIATLIHDDTIDKAAERRGRVTISNAWSSEVAILVGDYVFASSATHVCDTKDVRVIRRFSETIMELSKGELMEFMAANDWRQTRQQYEQRIYNKTASLFATSAESGAILSGAPESQIQALREYGTNLGMAFQVVDDILDFEATEEELGKPVGNDLAQGTLTLPVILVLERLGEKRFSGNNPFAALFARKNVAANLRRALEMIRESTAIRDSYLVAAEYRDRAIGSLEDVPDSSYKQALLEIADYALERRI
jgi:geranylgeranyl pyrophosphate synthase